MNKILITGAGGFIGYRLACDLSQSGYKVIGVDLSFPETAGPPRFQREETDFRNVQAMQPLLSDVDIVFHLASAHLSIALSKNTYWDVNVHSLRGLLEMVKEAGVQRMIHVSSVGVYGHLDSWPADEKSPCAPQSIYGETKLAGEAVVRDFCIENSLPYVILRPAWVYGATCPRTRKLYKALRDGKFAMIGKGRNMRHPLYISDMLAAFRLAMEKTNALGETLIVGGEAAVTTVDLINTLCDVYQLQRPRLHIPYGVGKLLAVGVESGCRIAGIEPPFSRRTLEFFDTHNAFDISKAKKLLGYTPQFSLKEGLMDARQELTTSV